MNRLHHAKSNSTLYRYIAYTNVIPNDLAVPETMSTTITPVTQPSATTQLPASYPSEIIAQLNQQVIDNLKTMFSKYKASDLDPLISEKITDLNSIFTQYRTNIDTDIRRLSAEVTTIARTTRPLSPPNVPSHGRSSSIEQTLKSQRTPTQTLTPSKLQTTTPNTEQAKHAEKQTQPLPSMSKAHAQTPAPVNTTNPSRPTLPANDPPSAQVSEPVSPTTSSDEKSDDEDNDTQSVHSNGTVHTVNTTHDSSPPPKRSLELESPKIERPRSLTDYSDQNLDAWIDHLSTKTSRFRKPPSDPKKDKAEATRIFNEYVTAKPPNREFAKRLTEEIRHAINAGRSISRSKRA
jgi:hypothetical protein